MGRTWRQLCILFTLVFVTLSVYYCAKGLNAWIDYKVSLKLSQREYDNSKFIDKSQFNQMVQETVIKPMQDQLKHLDTKIQTNAKPFQEVARLNIQDRKRILVTGGAGFVGSHLVDFLMKQGHEVTVVDNFFTGRKKNIEQWINHPNFELINHDVILPIYLEVDEIYHLASPASPPHYMYNPIKTVKCNTLGTINMLGLATRVRAKLLFASTSEVYGDPLEHPQTETYWGNVNPFGPRSCYDEGKRAGETLCYAYQQINEANVRIARIFNTFGPRMHINDGRVVSNLIVQALKNEKLTLYGDGSITRSFQYVSDLVAGLVKLMQSNVTTPVNLGNPDEYSIKSLAEIVKSLTGSSSEIAFLKTVVDDPKRRKPDISKALKELNWKPKVKLHDGLTKTIEYFQSEIFLNQQWEPYSDAKKIKQSRYEEKL